MTASLADRFADLAWLSQQVRKQPQGLWQTLQVAIDQSHKQTNPCRKEGSQSTLGAHHSLYVFSSASIAASVTSCRDPRPPSRAPSCTAVPWSRRCKCQKQLSEKRSLSWPRGFMCDMASFYEGFRDTIKSYDLNLEKKILDLNLGLISV